MSSIVWIAKRRLRVRESPQEISALIAEIQRLDREELPSRDHAMAGFLYLDTSLDGEDPFSRQTCVRIDAIDSFERTDSSYAETTPR